jgi:hypothetical protein
MSKQVIRDLINITPAGQIHDIEQARVALNLLPITKHNYDIQPRGALKSVNQKTPTKHSTQPQSPQQPTQPKGG